MNLRRGNTDRELPSVWSRAFAQTMQILPRSRRALSGRSSFWCGTWEGKRERTKRPHGCVWDSSRRYGLALSEGSDSAPVKKSRWRDAGCVAAMRYGAHTSMRCTFPALFDAFLSVRTEPCSVLDVIGATGLFEDTLSESATLRQIRMATNAGSRGTVVCFPTSSLL